MGFPVGNPWSEETRGDFALHDFKVWLDGEPVTAREEKGIAPKQPLKGINDNDLNYPAWVTWPVNSSPCRPGSSRTLTGVGMLTRPSGR